MDAYHGILCSCQKQWSRLFTALRTDPRNRVDKQKKSKHQIIWDFPGGPVVKTMLSGFPGNSVGKKKIQLSIQKAQVQSLIQKDPTCHRVTNLLHHNYWATALEPGTTTTEPSCHSYWSPLTLETMLCNKRSHCNDKPAHHSWSAAPAQRS